MRLTRRTSAFLIGFGVWSWIIWPTFLKNIWADDRSWQDGPTGFFTVHLLLTGVSLALGSAIGWLGVRGWRAAGTPAGQRAAGSEAGQRAAGTDAGQRAAGTEAGQRTAGTEAGEPAGTQTGERARTEAGRRAGGQS